MKKIIWIDGGIGRVICALPAIDEMSKKEKIIVVTPWKEIFLNKKNIDRLYKPDSEYLWEDVIANNDLVHVEPYWDVNYYKNKIHLITSFDNLINKTEIERTEVLKPNLVLNSIEEEFGKKFLKDIRTKTKKKIMILQPFGATGKLNDDKQIIDETNRSITFKTLDNIIDNFKDEYSFVYIGTVPLDKYDVEFKKCNNGQCRQPSSDSSKKKIVYPVPQDLGLRGIFSVIKHADALISCDSFTQHVAYSFDIPAVVFIGGTDEHNICYSNHLILKKEGYPIEYNPYRIPNNNHIIFANEGAMDFTEEEETEFIVKIREYLGVNQK